MQEDEQYIIKGSSYRMMVLEMHRLFVEKVSLEKKLMKAQNEKDFLRLKKQVANYERKARKRLRYWGFPTDGESSYCLNALEENLMEKYLIPLTGSDNHEDFGFEGGETNETIQSP